MSNQNCDEIVALRRGADGGPAESGIGNRDANDPSWVKAALRSAMRRQLGRREVSGRFTKLG